MFPTTQFKRTPSLRQSAGHWWFAFVLLGASTVSAYPFEIEWVRVFGGPGIEAYPDIITLDNGDLIVCYESQIVAPSQYDIIVHRLTSDGSIVWTRVIGGDRVEQTPRLSPTSDGGTVLVCQSSSYTPNNCWGTWVVKLDSLGDTTWTRSFCPYDLSFPIAVQQKSNGEYVVLIVRDVGGLSGLGILLLDSDGDSITFRDYPDDIEALVREPYDMILTDEDEIVVCGDGGDYISNPVIGWPHPWLAKFDQNGDSLWHYIFPFDETFRTIVKAHDGGFILGCKNFDHELRLVKTDSQGNILWNHMYDAYPLQRGFSAVELADSSIILLGDYPSNSQGYQSFLLETSQLGDSLWTTSFGWEGNDAANLSRMASDTEGGFVCVSLTSSFFDSSGGTPDILLVRFSESTHAIDLQPELFPSEVEVSAYPNPFNSILTISLEIPQHQEVTLSLFDLLGREVDVIHRGKLASNTINYTAPPTLSSGIYFLHAVTRTHSVLQKVVLLK